MNKKNKKRSRKKSKKTHSKRINKIKVIITNPHWFCLHPQDNICDQSSYVNSILLYDQLRDRLKSNVVLLKPPKLHRSVSDSNRGIQQNKYGIYHPSLKHFLNSITRNLNKKPKILLDIHSYPFNNNLPFYLLYLNIGNQREHAENFAINICSMMNINYSQEMVKEGTLDNEIIRLALKRKSIKMAIIIEIYDNNSNYIQNLLIESIKETVLNFI
tara:strand:+ start:2113 stop:2757 length:645 start_codon:yes stop_codon:yes gene_type:complete